MMAHPTPARHGTHAGHGHEASFLRTYVFSTDHKMIGKQFLFTSFIFLFIAGALALSLRWQLAYPGTPIPPSTSTKPRSQWPATTRT